MSMMGILKKVKLKVRSQKITIIQTCRAAHVFWVILYADIGGDSRHVPGSQPPFSLIRDSDQNEEDTSFISVLTCGVNIPLSRSIQFCPLPN